MQHPQPTTETTTSVCPSSPLPPTPPRCNPPSPLTSPPPPMSCHHRLLLLLVGASNQTALDTGEHLRTTQPTWLWRRRPHNAAWSISYDFFETSLISGYMARNVLKKISEKDIWLIDVLHKHLFVQRRSMLEQQWGPHLSITYLGGGLIFMQHFIEPALINIVDFCRHFSFKCCLNFRATLLTF